MSLIKYLTKVDRRPKLAKHTVTPYDETAMTAERKLVMLARRARDPYHAQKLIDELGLDKATQLPPPRRAKPLERFKAILRRFEGSQKYDPGRKQWRHHYRKIKGKNPKRIKRNYK